jgi:glycosyltransferase involved in cell wall biosynthesis
MIYICIPSYNEAPTVGLLLWKVRQVFAAFPREYQLVVADDGSTDCTRETLEPYARVLPLTILRHETRQGYAATVEHLLRDVVDRTDRPKRDSAILLHADFAHDAQAIPDLVRRIESGADIVIAEGRMQGDPSRATRLVRRFAPTILRPAVAVPGVRDIVSGYGAFRLFTLRNAFKSNERPLLTTDGWVANAELIGRAARHARRIDTVECAERHDLRQRPCRATAWQRFVELVRARRRLRVPPPTALAEPAAQQREPEMAAS